MRIPAVLSVLGLSLLAVFFVEAQSLPGNSGSSSPKFLPRTERVNLGGRWSTPPFVNNSGQKMTVGFTVLQEGDSVTILLDRPGKPNLVMFEGNFETATRIVGKSRGPSASDVNPYWVPETFTVVDATHLKAGSGLPS